MKRALHLIVLLFISINLFAQAPQKMTYQAVIRNASNNLVVSSPVKMKISILQGGATGTSVYSELHNPTTNANGLVSIEIGEGTNKTGTFSTIDWGNGTYFLKTETDPTNSTNYSIVGTSQLLSVPYALYSGNGFKGLSTTGDTLTLGNGDRYIIPGIKKVENFSFQQVVGGACWKLVAGPSGKLFIARYTDVLRSFDNGATWSNANWTLGVIRDGYSLWPGSVYNFITNQFIQCALDNGYWVSNNDGNTFVQTGPTGFGTGGVEMFQLSDGRVLGSMGGFQRGVHKSNDLTNTTWTNRYAGVDVTDFVEFQNNLVFSATSNNLLRSTDLGNTWSPVFNDNITDVERIQDSLFWINNQGNIYVANAQTISSSNTPRSNIGAGYFDAKYDSNKNIIVLTKLNAGIYISRDNGKTWTTMTIPGVAVYNDVTFYQGKVYIGTDKGLYSSIVP